MNTSKKAIKNTPTRHAFNLRITERGFLYKEIPVKEWEFEAMVKGALYPDISEYMIEEFEEFLENSNARPWDTVFTFGEFVYLMVLGLYSDADKYFYAGLEVSKAQFIQLLIAYKD